MVASARVSSVASTYAPYTARLVLPPTAGPGQYPASPTSVTTRPCWHLQLSDGIEIERGGAVHLLEPTVDFSADAAERRAQLRMLTRDDCCLQFPDTGYDELRLATVDGAMAALGV
jgi:hypothetical protein